jgi:multidrug efflux pump subunit AcrA (membrane-fusion protein)
VRAPFDGVVSDRKVSAGDTAAVGKELVKVIDPNSLRFEGLVSADSIGQVKAGQHVWFKVHGFSSDEFTGVIMRVNPAANITTRQVEVLVAFDDAKKHDDNVVTRVVAQVGGSNRGKYNNDIDKRMDNLEKR